MLYNKIIKNIQLTAWGSAFLFIGMLSSCESDVVDLNPVDKLSDQTAYETPKRCELSMVGAYDAAQCGEYNGEYTRGYPFGAASIMQGEMRGEDMNLSAVFYDYTYSATYTTTTSNNVHMWNTSFAAINRYNVVMDGETKAGEKGVLTSDVANQYKGECLFLRALTYHNLMIHFAEPYNVTTINNNYGMPLYLTPMTTKAEIAAGLKIGRSTIAETYKQIIADLDQAESLLPASNSANSITRATKGAAIALKTRVYLHMRNWAKVIEEAKKLVPQTVAPFSSSIGSYKLENDPITPFTSANANKESIFSIENSTDDNASVNGAMFAMMSCRTGARKMCPTSPTLYNSTYWLQDDKRRSEYVRYSEADTYYYCDKYQDANNADNAPIIRYAEVLLNYAEAALRTGDKAMALNLLNAVRNRSLASASTQAYTANSFADTKAFLTAILWERRIEFQGEGRRWEDIHRLAADDICPSGGIPAKIDYASVKGKKAFAYGKAIDAAWWSTKAVLVPYTEKRFIWPIPNDDIINNPTLAKQQNAGW